MDGGSSLHSKPLYLYESPSLADYYETEYYSEYDCNLPLLEHAVLSATSSLRERGPENARLNGKCPLAFIIFVLIIISLNVCVRCVERFCLARVC